MKKKTTTHNYGPSSVSCKSYFFRHLSIYVFVNKLQTNAIEGSLEAFRILLMPFGVKRTVNVKH